MFEPKHRNYHHSLMILVKLSRTKKCMNNYNYHNNALFRVMVEGHFLPVGSPEKAGDATLKLSSSTWLV